MLKAPLLPSEYYKSIEHKDCSGDFDFTDWVPKKNVQGVACGMRKELRGEMLEADAGDSQAVVMSLLQVGNLRLYEPHTSTVETCCTAQ